MILVEEVIKKQGIIQETMVFLWIKVDVRLEWLVAIIIEKTTTGNWCEWVEGIEYMTSSIKPIIEREKELQLAQKLLGMRIRIQSGREKPIDRLMKNILLLDVSSWK